jgi:signal transduction histidine kinase/CheY-like chemotaxis protein
MRRVILAAAAALGIAGAALLADYGAVASAAVAGASIAALLLSSRPEVAAPRKMEAVERLAGGVAHDFNNLLSAVLGYADLISSQPGLDERSRGYLAEIQGSARRAANLTTQLLAFSRRQLLQPVLLDLGAAVRDLERAARDLLGGTIAITLRAPDFPLRVKADPGQLREAILGLLANARDAMPGGGAVTLEAAPAAVTAPLRWNDETVPPGDYARVSVTDTGGPLPAGSESRLFDPFFHPRSPGTGAGLGLSTVFGIVKQSGGYVLVGGESDRGPTFSIYLPEARGAFRATTRIERAAPASRSATVLLVEDEEVVRRLAAEILKRAGHAVVQARHGEEGLEMFRAEPARFDLIVTDVVMPRLGGRELAEKVLAVRPDMKILYMSGYTDDAALQEGLLARRIPLLAKPFTPSSMAEKVRDVLGRP